MYKVSSINGNTLLFDVFEAACNFVEMIIIILQIVSESPYLTVDMLERSFPYTLLRDAYSSVYRHSHTVSTDQYSTVTTNDVNTRALSIIILVSRCQKLSTYK